jgi:hypothetical protein
MMPKTQGEVVDASAQAVGEQDQSGDTRARQDACTRLLDSYGGDATLALLDLARRAEIAVTYLDRAALQAHVGRAFTEDEWQRIAPGLDGYDEWLDNSGAAESIDYWISDILLPHAGVDPDADPDPGAAPAGNGSGQGDQ